MLKAERLKAECFMLQEISASVRLISRAVLHGLSLLCRVAESREFLPISFCDQARPSVQIIEKLSVRDRKQSCVQSLATVFETPTKRFIGSSYSQLSRFSQPRGFLKLKTKMSNLSLFSSLSFAPKNADRFQLSAFSLQPFL